MASGPSSSEEQLTGRGDGQGAYSFAPPVWAAAGQAAGRGDGEGARGANADDSHETHAVVTATPSRGDGAGRRVVRLEEILAAQKQKWEYNNIALKSIRDTNEDAQGNPLVERVELFDVDPYEILTHTRGNKNHVLVFFTNQAMVMACDAQEASGPGQGTDRG